MLVLNYFSAEVKAEEFVPAYDIETGEPIEEPPKDILDDSYNSDPFPEDATTADPVPGDATTADPASEDTTTADPNIEEENQEESTSYVEDDDSYSNSISTEDGREGESENQESSENQVPQTADYSEILQAMNVLHEDIQKVMISMWCLCGLYLGTKLIKGLFGNG